MTSSPLAGRTVLLLGGYGAVGRHAADRLRALGAVPVSAGRDPARADVVLDLADLPAVATASAEVDVVLNVSGREDPAVVTAVSSAGVPFVDISASPGYLAQVEALSPAAPVVLSVGIAPGLTNLMVHAVAGRTSGPLDIGIVLGAGEHHGPAAAAWTFAMLGRAFTDPSTGRPVRSYTQGSLFDLPIGRRRLLRTEFSDQVTLTRETGRPVRTYFGLDSRAVTAALATLTWVPGARHLPTSLPLPGREDWYLQVRDGSGPLVTVSGTGQSRATGVVAAEAVRLALDAPVGVSHLPALACLDDLEHVVDVRWDRAHR